MGHNQEHHNLLVELSLIFFGMFIIKVMPEASTVTIGFMGAVCFILGKYGKYFSMKKSEIPFRYRVLGWIVGSMMGFIMAMLMLELGIV